jgi:hypothetical protein
VIDVDPSIEPRRSPRPVRLLGVLVVIGILVLVGVINRHRSADNARRPNAAIPSLTPPRPPTRLPAPTISDVALPGAVLDIAARAPLMYALTSGPSTLVRIAPERPPVVIGTAPTSTSSYGLVLDDQTSRVWVLSHRGKDSTEILQYDPLSLSPIESIVIRSVVTAAMGFDLRLWLGTAAGLYVVEDGSAMPVRVPGADGRITAIQQDPPRDRVLVSREAAGGIDVLAVDSQSRKIVLRSWLPIRNSSMALVLNNLWIGGTANDRRAVLLHLDVASLRLLGSEPRGTDADRSVLWPGDTVIWASIGPRLFCLSPRDGSTLTSTTSMSGPVVPSLGDAYAIGGRSLHVLELGRTGCSG